MSGNAEEIRSKPYQDIIREGDALLKNIDKSYKRGYQTQETPIKHANTLIKLLNNFIVSSRTVPSSQECLVRAEWPIVQLHVKEAFEKLKIEKEIPEELPTVPIQGIGSYSNITTNR